MFRASTLRIIGWVLLTPVVLATAYMLLEIWLFDIDPCSPFICTEGYPCFDQGNCSSLEGPPGVMGYMRNACSHAQEPLYGFLSSSSGNLWVHT